MIRHMVAIDSRRGIAKGGVQPWKLPTDEEYFTEQTKKYGGIVLMGRKTYEVIGRPLLERQNFVLTRNPDFAADGVTPVHDLEDFLAQHADVWVIGGAELFEATLSQAEELCVTQIDADFGCDTFYPEFESAFELARRGEDITENNLTFRFEIYRPRTT